jgi:hypothetical protein
VYSQGLLVPAPDTHAFGDRVDQTFGVTYHRPPEPGENGTSVHTQVGRARRQPVPVYSVDSLKKLPRLFEDGQPVVVTEKIHGTNVRFGWIPRKVFGVRFGWKFVVGSHRVMKDGAAGGFYKEDLWTSAAQRFRLAQRTELVKGLVFYGELYGFTQSGQAIQKGYTYGRTPESGPGLVIFDVKKLSGDEYLSYPDRKRLVDGLGLEHAPVLRATVWDEQLLELAEGRSTLHAGTQREGVVVESWGADPRKKAKYVGQGYLLAKEAA